MSSWEDGYDDWKTNQPEPKSKLKCKYCGDDIFPGERLYNIWGDHLCQKCATEWFEEQWTFAQEDDCNGDW